MTSALFSIVGISAGVCWRLTVERDLTTIFSSVDEPIDAERVKDENRY